MVPSAFVLLDELPLSPNGKLDLKALPVPELTRPDIEEMFVPPRTPTEEAIAQVWAETLGFKRIGVRDNFFELGGHSLQVTQITFQIYDLFAVDIPLASFFDEPTVGGLAAIVSRSVTLVPGRHTEGE